MQEKSQRRVKGREMKTAERHQKQRKKTGKKGRKMENQSIKDQVYQGILEDILDGVYDVNTVIREKEMIEKYHVSKTPVREALVQLCAENTLRNIPRYGYQVVAITPQQILEVIEYRKIIELGALSVSASRMTEANLQELDAINEEEKRIASIHDYKIHWNCNLEFHRKLCSFAGNSYLQQALEEAMRLYTRISNQYYATIWNHHNKQGIGNHEQIVEALRSQELDRAKEILARDLEAFRKELL